jgi:SNF2 family DNA or RNA helicase
LDIIERELQAEGHYFTRIDGKMNAVKRIEAMDKFRTEECDSPATPRFILCSLMACGTGITLTRGNWVFMMDTWWNVAAENQAMDRVHRIGQTRPVKAVRFIMEGSIEQRFVKLQNAKEALGKGSLQKLTREDREKAKLTAMKDLFEVGDSAVQWEGWYDDDNEEMDDEGDDLDGFIVDG